LTVYDLNAARDRIRPYVDRARGFSGWQLDEFTPKPLGPTEPWSYEARAGDLLRNARSVLDMGTGGGEVFERLCSSFGGQAVATEPWSVNAPVAAARLRPHGIAVVRCGSLQLPFRAATFDLVLNRHEELDPAEVARVVSRGGRVLTQQIGRNWWRELRAFFPRMQDFGDLFRRYERGFRTSHLAVVEARTHEWKAAYRGLGDIVFLLCVAPWEIPDFDPLGRDLPALLAAEEALSTDDGIVLTESLFLIEAMKDADEGGVDERFL
jgi:SAM-dependent methyltransferase